MQQAVEEGRPGAESLPTVMGRQVRRTLRVLPVWDGPPGGAAQDRAHGRLGPALIKMLVFF